MGNNEEVWNDIKVMIATLFDLIHLAIKYVNDTHTNARQN